MTYPLPAIEGVFFKLPTGVFPYDLVAIDALAKNWTFVTQWLQWRTGLAIRFNPVLQFIETEWPLIDRRGNQSVLISLIKDKLCQLNLFKSGYTFVSFVPGALEIPFGGYWVNEENHVGIALLSDQVIGPMLIAAGRSELSFVPWNVPSNLLYLLTDQSALYTVVHEIGHAAFGLDHGLGELGSNLMLERFSVGLSDTPNFLARHRDQLLTSPYVFGTSDIALPMPPILNLPAPQFSPGQSVILPSWVFNWGVPLNPPPSIGQASRHWYENYQKWGYAFKTQSGVWLVVPEEVIQLAP